MLDKDQIGIYAYFDNETEECVYIGIATTGLRERHMNHLKPSKYNDQPINKWLQDRREDEDWTYIVLDVYDHIDEKETEEMEKEIVHIKEKYLIKRFKPSINIYHNKNNKRGELDV